VKLHRVEVLARERFEDNVLLRYRWTESVPEPGQFVMVRPRASALDPFLARPFFAHDYGGGVISLLFEVRGRGTALLARESVEELLVSGPLGEGFALGDGPVALVGSGVYYSPLKLLGRRLREAGIPYDSYLEVPDGTPEAYASWLSGIYPDAALVPTDGSRQALRTLLGRLGDPSHYSTIYASGTSGMLVAVRGAAAGKVPAQLALRERMACANGSCYGCAIPIRKAGVWTYSRSCVEGPVFPAEALAW
jgi:dihydroorotate dehydrogenase electron transfer subunit